MQAGNGNIEIKSGIYIFIIFFMPLSFFFFVVRSKIARLSVIINTFLRRMIRG